MFLCLKGRLPKAWKTHNKHPPISSQSHVVSISETNSVAKRNPNHEDSFGSQASFIIGNDGTASSTTIENSTEAFRSLSRWLDSSDEDAAFWWHATGCLLGLLLAESSYDLHSQFHALLCYNRCVVRSLGARPAENSMHKVWKSYMTDDHSPIEFSWNWGDSTKPPQVRCTIEAVPSALDLIDPFNQAEAAKLASDLRVTLPNTDWQLFDYFTNAFRPSAGGTSQAAAQAEHRGYRSSTFLGFEFDKTEVAAKAYFAPVIESGDSRWKAIIRSVKTLEHGQVTFPALLELERFLADCPEGGQVNVEGLAIDCVPLSKSRLKIYARTPLTSFDSVRTYMTMGGKILYSDKVWRQLRDLWSLVLGLDEAFLTSEDLPFKNHLTAGMMYNYNIKAGNALPEVKLYINTRHYGRNDLDIAQGLTVFMQEYGRGDFTSNYRRAVDAFCTYRSLDRECGVQTYISCAVQNDSLSLTSYLSPQVYHRLGFYR